MTTQMYLTKKVAMLLAVLGRKIRWHAPCADDNSGHHPDGYTGVAIIKRADFDKFNPLEVEAGEGDDLKWAFLSYDGEHLAYSDDDRYITFDLI